MHADKDEHRMICRAKSMLVPASIYQMVTSDPTCEITPDFVESMVKFLLSVAELQVKGDYNFDPHTNWIKRANELSPAAFSKLFQGEVCSFLGLDKQKRR
jgi:hypothetical protein